MEQRTTLGARIESVANLLSPPVLTARSYHRRRAIVPALFAVGIGSVPLWAKVDRLGVLFALGIGAVAAGVALYHLWRAGRAGPDEQFVRRTDDRPLNEQASELRGLLIYSMIAVPALSAWVAWDLYRLETGRAQSVLTWAPVAMLYETLGFWPAVLVLPALGVFVLVAGRRRLRQLAEAQARQQSA